MFTQDKRNMHQKNHLKIDIFKYCLFKLGCDHSTILWLTVEYYVCNYQSRRMCIGNAQNEWCVLCSIIAAYSLTMAQHANFCDQKLSGRTGFISSGYFWNFVCLSFYISRTGMCAGGFVIYIQNNVGAPAWTNTVCLGGGFWLEILLKKIRDQNWVTFL